MFGKLGVDNSGGGSDRAPRDAGISDDLCFRLDLMKATKVLMASFCFLAVGGWLFLDELKYWNEGVYGKQFFAACGCLLFAAIALPFCVRDFLRRNSVYLRLTPRGLKALGWSDELRWSEIADFSIYTQRYNGRVMNKLLYVVCNRQVVNRVCPSQWQRLGQLKDGLSGNPGLRIPVDRIAGDAHSVAELIYGFWSKHK
jgi:hypothetical protein